MKKAFYLKIITVILAVISLSGCVSSTLIQSYPPGAKVYVNGEPKGLTPYWYSDSKILGSITNIDLVKDGYEPLYTSIERNEQVDVGAIIGGFICGIPFLWTLQYNPTHNYELIPLGEQKQDVPLVEAPFYNQDKSSNSTSIQTQVEKTPTRLDRLKELKQLLDENLITKDDYEKQKQKILDEI
ncbi:MAG: PEGA domain-containing protein [Paludibacter sp.]|nr:PEGA domain-containing protein [Paludibacter sp.]